MPLDHYISQVHIRKFCSPDLDGRVYAIRKSDLKKFAPRPQDVCRIDNNSSNGYLRESRAIEDFLKIIEPKYSVAVTQLREGQINSETVLAIAGFVAYVLACSPAGMRIQSAPLKNAIEAHAMMLDKLGESDKAPESLGDKSMTELIKEGVIAVKVDGKYPQAIGISSIGDLTSMFGNSPWEILLNNDTRNPFVTSDFPVAVEIVNRWNPIGRINRVVPLAPDLALRIFPDVTLRGIKPDFTFARARCRQIIPHHQEVFAINRLLVQCAEDLVIYRSDTPWIERMVAKYKSSRVEAVTEKIEDGDGYFLPATLSVRSMLR